MKFFVYHKFFINKKKIQIKNKNYKDILTINDYFSSLVNLQYYTTLNTKILNKKLCYFMIKSKKKKNFYYMIESFSEILKHVFIKKNIVDLSTNASFVIDYLYNLKLIKMMHNYIYLLGWCLNLSATFFYLKKTNSKVKLHYLKPVNRVAVVLKWIRFSSRIKNNTYSKRLKTVLFDSIFGFKQSNIYSKKKDLYKTIFNLRSM